MLAAGQQFGYPFMLKARRLAYDGRGNAVVHNVVRSLPVQRKERETVLAEHLLQKKHRRWHAANETQEYIIRVVPHNRQKQNTEPRTTAKTAGK